MGLDGLTKGKCVMGLTVCKNNHPPIRHEMDGCPLCAALVLLDSVRRCLMESIPMMMGEDATPESVHEVAVGMLRVITDLGRMPVPSAGDDPLDTTNTSGRG